MTVLLDDNDDNNNNVNNNVNSNIDTFFFFFFKCDSYFHKGVVYSSGNEFKSQSVANVVIFQAIFSLYIFDRFYLLQISVCLNTGEVLDNIKIFFMSLFSSKWITGFYLKTTTFT